MLTVLSSIYKAKKKRDQLVKSAAACIAHLLDDVASVSVGRAHNVLGDGLAGPLDLVVGDDVAGAVGESAAAAAVQHLAGRHAHLAGDVHVHNRRVVRKRLDDMRLFREGRVPLAASLKVVQVVENRLDWKSTRESPIPEHKTGRTVARDDDLAHEAVGLAVLQVKDLDIVLINEHTPVGRRRVLDKVVARLLEAGQKVSFGRHDG